MKTPESLHSRTPPNDLETQAWNWLRLLNSGDAREQDAQRFLRWVHASPAHRTAYNDVKRRWDAIEPHARAVLQHKPEAIKAQQRRAVVPQLSGRRRAFLGAAVGAAAAAGVAVLYPPLNLWPAPGQWNADDRTATGEQRTLALADSVNVTLNTQTSIRRQTAGNQTIGLELLTGEAAIDLKGVGRSFAVVAGAGRSVAEAGRFEVRHLHGKVCVTCIVGTVRVEHPAGTRRLQARQQTIYGAAAVSEIAGIEPKTVSAWRQGMLVFDMTRLADAIDEINRYRPGRVVLMNDAARNKPVTGVFAIASLDVALWQLQEAFALHPRSLPAGLLVLT